MKLPDWRYKHGVTQADFAERMTKAGQPATPGLVSQLESGYTGWTLERALCAQKITKGKVSLAALLGPSRKKK